MRITEDLIAFMLTAALLAFAILGLVTYAAVTLK